MTKGPRRPRRGRPDEPFKEPTAEDLTPAFRYWVTGQGVVYSRNRELRRKVFAAREVLVGIGLHLHRQDLQGDEERPKRKRYGFKMITLDEVVGAISDVPGRSREALVEAVYRTEPWTPEAKVAAERRFVTALRRVRSDCPDAVLIKYDPAGRPLYDPGPGAKGFINDHIRRLGTRACL